MTRRRKIWKEVREILTVAAYEALGLALIYAGLLLLIAIIILIF